MLRTEYRLVRQMKGRGHHAIVWLDIEPTASGIEILQSEKRPDEYAPAWSPDVTRDEMAGAVAGIEHAANVLIRTGVIPGCKVHLLVVDGLLVDISPESCWMAGAMAVCKAFLPEDQMPVPGDNATEPGLVFPDQG